MFGAPISNSYASGDRYWRAEQAKHFTQVCSRISACSRLAIEHLSVRIRRNPMMDVVMLAISFAFFALTIGYVYACDRL